MKGVARDRGQAEGFLLSRVGSCRELPHAAGAGAGEATRKHVRNDAAGAGASKSVMCEFMGQPVGDMRMHRSRRLLPAPEATGRLICALTMIYLAWPRWETHA
jgi:hypothetical protein